MIINKFLEKYAVCFAVLTLLGHTANVCAGGMGETSIQEHGKTITVSMEKGESEKNAGKEIFIPIELWAMFITSGNPKDWQQVCRAFNSICGSLNLPPVARPTLPSGVNITGEEGLGKYIGNKEFQFPKVNVMFPLTDEDLVALVEANPNITHLQIINGENLTDVGIVAMANRCHDLTEITLTGCNEQVGEDSFRALAQGCSKLKKVRFPYCHITDMDLKNLSMGCGNISEIDLSSDGISQHLITDEGIEVLSLNCPMLSEVNLSHRRNVSDDAIANLVTHCPGITKLNLSGCCTLSTTVIAILQENCKNLIAVNLEDIHGILDLGEIVTEVLGTLPHLKEIRLSMCRMVRADEGEWNTEKVASTPRMYIKNRRGERPNRDAFDDEIDNL